MVDREKLKRLVYETQIILLTRIRKLSEAAGLLDAIKIEADGNESDEYLKRLIMVNLSYKQILDDLDADLVGEEFELWNKMVHIDQQEEEES